MSFIKFYVKLKDEKLNLIFEKRAEESVANKNIPMGVEEIIIQQAKEEGLEIRLYEIIKKLIIKGKSNLEICDLLDVEEGLVQRIRNEVMG